MTGWNSTRAFRVSGALTPALEKPSEVTSRCTLAPGEEGSKKPRRYYRINGTNGPDWDIPNNDIESVKHAILEENMVGHKLGEFSPTRSFRGHAGAKNKGKK
jgi:hypothetical protein